MQSASTFLSQPHCRDALQQHDYVTIDMASGRSPGADSDPVGSNVFFRSLLFRIDGIRDLQAFFTDKTAESDGELLMFFSIGRAVDGHEGVAHGGFVATLLDNLLGFGAHLVTRHAGLFTVRLDVEYTGAIQTPGIVVGRSRVTREEGRKVWTSATLEDSRGKICAKATCLFIKSKPAQSKM